MDLLRIINALAVGIVILIVTVNVRRLYIKTKKKWSLPLLTLIVSATFLFSSLPTFVLLPIFFIYREFVKSYLKFKHGSRFKGLIQGADVTYLVGGHNKNAIAILLMLESVDTRKPEDIYEDYKNVVHKSFFVNPTNLLTLHCGIRKCGGYAYKFKEDVTANEYVRKMKTVDNSNTTLSTNELTNLINTCINEPLPKNNTLVWDSFIGTQPIDWNSGPKKNNVNYYPLLFRVHHAIGDGFCVAQLLALMVDKSDQEDMESFLKNTKKDSTFKSILNNIGAIVFAAIFMPSEFLLNFLDKKPPNVLRGPKLTGDDILALKVDNGDYFKKVKKIKQQIPTTGFADVVMTAFSASFNDYFNNHSSQCHEEISIVVPFLRKTTSLRLMPSGPLGAQQISFSNSFIMLTVDFPISIESNENSNSMQRLEVVKKQLRNPNNSTTNKMMYFWTHIGNQAFPVLLLEKTFKVLQWTTILSILPGPPKLTMADGNLPVENLLFWIPQLAGMGINISVMTYDDRLHLGLKVDKALISNEKDAQSILDGVFYHLDLLGKEIE